MEDVSMGMWVEQFNSSMAAVQYSHNWKFCQYGCMENYYTAHYQSPRQMICLWDKLARGRAQCCNFRWRWETPNFRSYSSSFSLPSLCIFLLCADYLLSRLVSGSNHELKWFIMKISLPQNELSMYDVLCKRLLIMDMVSYMIHFPPTHYGFRFQNDDLYVKWICRCFFLLI